MARRGTGGFKLPMLIEALRCSKCGGLRTICASITDAVVARRILEWVGIDPDLPRFEPLRC